MPWISRLMCQWFNSKLNTTENNNNIERLNLRSKHGKICQPKIVALYLYLLCQNPISHTHIGIKRKYANNFKITIKFHNWVSLLTIIWPCDIDNDLIHMLCLFPVFNLPFHGCKLMTKKMVQLSYIFKKFNE